ncbi:MAG: hypothetical protein JST05_06180 [Acidobacteria bacterium]|nr:hypothetical protein [Acidobacteriota bacterium]
MRDALYSPYIIPVIAIVSGMVYIAISAWKKVQEDKIALEREIRLKELELKAQASREATSAGETKTH